MFIIKLDIIWEMFLESHKGGYKNLKWFKFFSLYRLEQYKVEQREQLNVFQASVSKKVGFTILYAYA